MKDSKQRADCSPPAPENTLSVVNNKSTKQQSSNGSLPIPMPNEAHVMETPADSFAGAENRLEVETFQGLTPRLQEVLQLVAEGWSTKEIAARLAISKKTVEFHRSRLTKKLHIHSPALLARFAVRVGAVDP